jgi:hypothetical protein
VPDAALIPVGDGPTLSSIVKALRDNASEKSEPHYLQDF